MKKEKLKTLEEANGVIQMCDCGKVDAYKNDGHNCGTYINRAEDEDSYEHD
jgi:hypothetical protein